ncbi:T9SS type A sorting domain-containing protein [Flavobacterium sp. MAH-1]|uniref:T9SS type A sorting domain-containing protein n=1 Tax=Flavobacterium agri TaxID=2743471 RepID=A0A7Y9C3W3_9FLAO|nr:T9SS type A sorting domain-containing protein [Flavobacterium agri]NUY79516.1 T9SS type A sorting domain-containing protein [Flavobacterium agri]NYA69541.1 T9SS type A sorting domain-containing protein [Flavobacterium agri]
MTRLLLCFFCLSVFIGTNAQTNTTIFNGSSNTSGLAIRDNFLYMATTFDGTIHRIDVSNTGSGAQLVKSGLGTMQGICFKDNYLYAALDPNAPGVNKIIRLDVSQNNPVAEDVVLVQDPNGIAISGQFLYISSGHNIYKVDLSQTNPSLQLLASDMGSVFGTVGLAVKDGYLFASDSNKLVKYDLSQNSPTKITVAANLPLIQGIVASPDENYIYAASYSPSTIKRIDIASGQSQLLASISVPTLWDIEFRDGIFYTTNLEGGQVTQTSGALSLSENELSRTNVYPNPAENILHLENCTFEALYDVRGVVMEIPVSADSIDLSSLSTGVYLLKIRTSKAVETRRIVKK